VKNRTLTAIAATLAVAIAAHAATIQLGGTQDATPTGLTGFVAKYNATVTALNEALAVVEASLGTNVAATATVAGLTISNPENAGAATLTFVADKGDDAGDTAAINVPDGGNFEFQSDTSVKGTLATKFTVAKDGKLTMAGGAILDNTTSATELNITENTVKVTGALAVTTTAQVDGVLTSGKTGSNGGLVVKSTGAGATTFSVAGASGDTVVAGTLGVTGVATLAAAPKLTAVTAVGSVALTTANGPAAADDHKDTPIYLTITVGGSNYVVAAWALTP